MKHILALSVLLLLTACSLGSSQEIKSAEKLLSQFECKNIDDDQLTHNPITGFHQRSLSVSRDKALQYIESVKNGDSPSEIPLNEMVEQQYMTYKSACEFLGGVTNDIDDLKQHNS